MGEAESLEELFQGLSVGQVDGLETEIRFFLQHPQTVFFQLYRVVIIEIVNAENLGSAGSEPFGEVKADEPGRARDENFHVMLHVKRRYGTHLTQGALLGNTEIACRKHCTIFFG